MTGVQRGSRDFRKAKKKRDQKVKPTTNIAGKSSTKVQKVVVV